MPHSWFFLWCSSIAFFSLLLLFLQQLYNKILSYDIKVIRNTKSDDGGGGVRVLRLTNSYGHTETGPQF